MKKQLVVIGNGMAGIRTVEELLKVAPELYEITVFGDEPHGNYNRIMLSPVLAGEKSIDDIILNDLSWYENQGIKLWSGRQKRIVKIDRKHRKVFSQDGTSASYDRLLIATGSRPFIIPLPGKELKGVITFRDIRDVEAMLSAAKSKSNAVVIGGGLLGLEAANGLAARGMQVTVVHNSDVLMNRQLDQAASSNLKKAMESRGIGFCMSARASALCGDDNGVVQALQLDNGVELPADLVVMAAGIQPNIQLAEQAGLHCQQGIVVSDTLQTYDPSIYAVGECIQHRGELFGMVAPLWGQAKVCANHLAQFGNHRYQTKAVSTKLKVTGIDLFSAGDFLGDEQSETLVFEDPDRDVYKKLTIRNHRIAGILLYGDTKDGPWYFQLMQDKTDITTFRNTLLFGKANADHNATATLDITANAAKSQKPHNQLQALLNKQLPDELAVCRCTALSHQSIQSAIRQYRPRSPHQLFRILDFKEQEGCRICRPAIDYYLESQESALHGQERYRECHKVI